MVGLLQVGIDIQQGRRVGVGRLDDGAVPHDVHELEPAGSVLAVAEDVALAAQGQVEGGQLEAVIGGLHGRQAREGLLPGGGGDEEHLGRLGAAAYATPQLVELAQIARKNGLLALEEQGNQQQDPFFKQCIMLIVDNNDADQAREIMMNDIEQSSARHEAGAGMYDRGSSVAPAFGMVGTLVGLINMLKAMDVESGGGDLGPAMATALVTTLYGCVLAHMVFGPIANQLRLRDEEETLCKLIIVEGIMSIQAGSNPKALREKLLTFVAQRQRDGSGGGKKGKGGDAAE